MDGRPSILALTATSETWSHQVKDASWHRGDDDDAFTGLRGELSQTFKPEEPEKSKASGRSADITTAPLRSKTDGYIDGARTKFPEGLHVDVLVARTRIDRDVRYCTYQRVCPRRLSTVLSQGQSNVGLAVGIVYRTPETALCRL